MILKICIGGDLDGVKIDLNKKSFKATEIDSLKSSEYFKQVYVKNEKIYSFWICKDLSPKEAAKRAEDILVKLK
ncbi:hypothetical protein [Acinetobacter baumannii]|uniref:hypothetical protein n=1 Tax=Acinetobacter baumannii TaxID=470 RepID=UPI0002BA365D|nr:hypothetical protein [Acinetobacter baumannii]EHU1281705.1 hypothetical protein [Acinetobacter baumannii]EHU1366802.1 hypothetical protein [Acinetobacter baumannii]EHU1387051.1 hypothetical protein [Acinetobacter baumannii]EHU1399325.1 hypothetical protein [Acinetobacter baumannii]EHU1679275.1 hypothetical protein [Acinetobacter baumannii]